MKSISAIHPAITENMENMLVKRMPQRLVIGKPISQYASYSGMFCPLHSNIGKEQLKSISEIHPVITENAENILVKRAPHQSHNVSISAMSNLGEGGCEVPLCLVLKPFSVYRKSSPYTVVKKGVGDQRGTKVAP